MKLDVEFIRSHFPAFREPSLAGWSFFENAGGSYMCQQVIDRLLEFYTQSKVQPYYPFPASIQGGERMDESYTRLSAYLNVVEDEISFGPSTSQNVYVLANALRPMWQAGKIPSSQILSTGISGSFTASSTSHICGYADSRRAFSTAYCSAGIRAMVWDAGIGLPLQPGISALHKLQFAQQVPQVFGMQAAPATVHLPA